MTPVGKVRPGALVFMECGCAGIRGVSPPDGPVLIVVERPCAIHPPTDTTQLRYLEFGEPVSPFIQPVGL